MENKFTAEQIEKAKTCKTVKELIALTNENGIELTEAEATNLFAMLNPTFGELSDSELETVAGGCGNGDEDEDVKCPKCGSSSWSCYMPNLLYNGLSVVNGNCADEKNVNHAVIDGISILIKLRLRAGITVVYTSENKIKSKENLPWIIDSQQNRLKKQRLARRWTSFSRSQRKTARNSPKPRQQTILHS